MSGSPGYSSELPSLPDELIVQIAAFSGPNVVAVLGATCKSINRLFGLSKTYKILVELLGCRGLADDGELDWKEEYRAVCRAWDRVADNELIRNGSDGVIEFNSDGSIKLELVTQENQRMYSHLESKYPMFPLPQSAGRAAYYEVEVLGKYDTDCGVCFGLAGHNLISGCPGWHLGSYGWHGDDGSLFLHNPFGQEGPGKFGTGDVVGAGIHLDSSSGFFTWNGDLVAWFHIDPELRHCLHAHITSCMSDRISVNLGERQFVYQLENLHADASAFVEKTTYRLRSQINSLVQALSSSDLATIYYIFVSTERTTTRPRASRV
eukprot:TRINITY_DN7151_c0_g1_i2.p1 TRINITY_DN7151_c0_g1~~TRINITY_DN7151_c0_g1_i2.p1  ORF type:complete len:339 (+),score=22.68 TRINITY_DN7151_c0_g1_i2:56-1018(+)